MKSLSQDFLASLSLSSGEAATLRKLGEYKGRQALFERQTPEVLAKLKSVALIESSESSNRLEGIKAPYKRIQGLILNKFEPRDRSEQEIAGYRDALNLIHESPSDIPFSADVIRQLHQTLYRYLPKDGGSWKPTDNQIVEKNDRGEITRVRFDAVPAVATPQAMKDLTAIFEIAANHESEPLLIIPAAILDFLCIHPFTDGNGRIARLLTLLLLYRFDYNVGRYISLERIFEESGETYYESLEASSHGWHEGRHNLHPWMEYFWGVLLRAYKEYEQRVGTVKRTRGSKAAGVRDAVRRRIKPFQISEIELDCPGTSRPTIRKELRKMRDEGEIESTGAGRGARWRRVGGP